MRPSFATVLTPRGRSFVVVLAVLVVTGSAAAWLAPQGEPPPAPLPVVDAALLVSQSTAAAGDGLWPRFRGPNGDAISTETGLLTSWDETAPRELWRVPLGEGYSGISVRGGRLFTMFGRGGGEWVGSFTADTGAELWRLQIDALYRDGQGNGPRSTPTLDGDLVFALGARGKLFALQAADGTVAWSHDLVAEFGARPPTWGVATQPLVDGDLLLVNAGGRRGASLIAFDKRSGEVAWRTLDDTAGYAAPLVVEVGGIHQVLFFTAEGLVSVAPATGRVYWRAPWRTSLDVNAAAPVFIAPDRVFISSGYDTGGAVYRIAADASAARELWRNRELRNQFSSSLYLDGFLYGFDGGTLKCVDARTGEMTWRARGLGQGSLIAADGHLIILGESGTLVIAEADPTTYVEKGRLEVFRGRSWTAPSLVEGRLYLRDERSMVAVEMRAPSDS